MLSPADRVSHRGRHVLRVEYLRPAEEMELPGANPHLEHLIVEKMRLPVPGPAHRLEFPVQKLREGHGAGVRLRHGIASHRLKSPEV